MQSFFHICEIFINSPAFSTSFLYKEKIYLKQILQPPNWSQSWPPAGHETNFFIKFKGGLVHTGTSEGSVRPSNS